MNQQKRVLVAPLDWGLGHASRCIPIVQALINHGATVILATSGGAFDLLTKEFPQLQILSLPSYSVRYFTRNMVFNLAVQLPKILWAIIREHQALKTIVKEHQVDVVISDNRFGCFNRQAESIFITHQLYIRLPYPLSWFENLLQFFHHFLIKKFDSCWIPDFASTQSGLSGNLAHPPPTFDHEYIGPLSRMKYIRKEKKRDIIVVLSGPEPQRSKLEGILTEQFNTCDQKILIVQGKTTIYTREKCSENLESVSFLTSEALNEALMESGLLICRSGYSSIMDLAHLGMKAILIPTPGQTEQEYLAQYFYEKGIFYYQQQKNFDLRKARQNAEKFNGFKSRRVEEGKLDAIIQKLLS